MSEYFNTINNKGIFNEDHYIQREKSKFNKGTAINYEFNDGLH